MAGSDEAAIDHLLSAGLFDEAADRIEAVGRACGAPTVVHLPGSLCDALPDAVLRARPYIRMLRAAVDVRQGKMAEAYERLVSVVDELRAQRDPGTAAALGVFCEAAAAVGDWAGAGSAVTELLDMPIPPEQRVLALVNKLWLDYYGGNAEGVVDDVDEVIRVDPRDPQVCEAWFLALDCKLLGTPLDAPVLESHCATLLRRCEDSDVAIAAASGLRAGIELLRGGITAALETVRTGRQASDRAGGLGWLEHEFDLVEMMAALATSRHEEVERIAAPRLAREDPVSLLHLPQNALALARSRWIRGDRSGLADVHRRLQRLDPRDDGLEMVLARAGVSHMVDRAAGDERAAVERLEATLREVPTAAMFAVSHGCFELDLAAALMAAGDESAALHIAGQPLAELASRDFPGIVAQHGAPVVPLLRAAVSAGVERRFAERVLSIMDVRPESFTAPETGERLSGRELEVLRLAASGASNRAIAEALFISERTVKSHMTAILRKLGVRSRTQAAHEARRLGLV